MPQIDSYTKARPPADGRGGWKSDRREDSWKLLPRPFHIWAMTVRLGEPESARQNTFQLFLSSTRFLRPGFYSAFCLSLIAWGIKTRSHAWLNEQGDSCPTVLIFLALSSH